MPACALSLRAGCESPGQPTARDLGFGVVPRINAAGRIADAELAMALLLEEEPDGGGAPGRSISRRSTSGGAR